MTKYERAQQLWSILVLAAKNRQVLTYGIITKLTGLRANAVGKMLSPLQNYCLNRGKPPLTILVVKEKSGIPGDGFIAARDIPMAQQDVFNYNWFKWGCPQSEELQKYDKPFPK